MNKYSRLIFQIKSIFGGISDTWHFADNDQFIFSLGIDPEGATSSVTKPLGGILPTQFSKFTGANLDGAPMWLSGAATSTGVWVYSSNGTVLTYSSILAEETAVGTTEGGAGNGMTAYNDYIYLSTGTSVARYGRISATAPTLSDYWVASLTMSALVNTSYPGINYATYPNHVLHPHSDGRTYIADYDGKNGRIHSFTTDADGTNGSGTYNDLTLPPGLMPMSIKSYGTDLAVLASSEGNYVSGSIPIPGRSALILWDCIPGNAAYRIIPISEPLATALVNKNGELYVVVGKADRGFKLLHYLGGSSFETLVSVAEGSPPPAGAIDTSGNQIIWGGYVTYPTSAAGAFTYGYKNGRLASGGFNNIARISSVDTFPIVTSISYILSSSSYPLIGWRSSSNYGVDKNGGTNSFASVFKSQMFQVGKKFTIKRITIPLNAAITSGMIITPSVFVDDDLTSTDLTTINYTNYPSENLIDYQNLSISGNTNFSLQFSFTGTVQVGIGFPVTIEVEICD